MFANSGAFLAKKAKYLRIYRKYGPNQRKILISFPNKIAFSRFLARKKKITTLQKFIMKRQENS